MRLVINLDEADKNRIKRRLEAPRMKVVKDKSKIEMLIIIYSPVKLLDRSGVQ
jgi:hypothetical protein